MTNGKFVISLDFELMWGVRDVRDIANYGSNILGVQLVVPKLLEMFRKYEVKATFSSVGFLFFETKQDLLDGIPSLKPIYTNPDLSPYNGYIDNLTDHTELDNYHFAPNLLREIKQYQEHEIGCHTFSHYYCLEPGQTLEMFKADIESAISIANKLNIKLTSIVFPRNQVPNDDYLKICMKLGIFCFRGNERSFLYKARSFEDVNAIHRLLRLLDAYVNISGHNCYSDDFIKSKFPLDIPSSRFLRPFSRKLKFFDGFKLRRIKSGMTYAAKNNLTYHLWWHPHNFGINQNENFSFLDKILAHYQFLNKTYNFNSYNMSSLATTLIKEE
jgi:hypothetical protein